MKRTATPLLFALALASVPTPARAAGPSAGECAMAAEKALGLRKEHKLRDARKQLLVCASASCPGEIRDECARRIGEVNAAIPSVVFEVKDDAGADLSAVTLSMDGQKLTDKLDGTAISLEPGEHQFRFEAAGKPALEKKLVIREGEKDRRERVMLAAPSSTVTPPATDVSPPPPVAETPPPKTQKTFALVTGSVGLAGLAAGVAFGIVATVKWSDAKAACVAGCAPTAPAQSDRNVAQTAATGANIAFIAGGVLLATGVVLWFTAPHARTSTGARVRLVPSVGLGGAGLILAGEL